MTTLAQAMPRHDRVREHTAPIVNERIDGLTEREIQRLSGNVDRDEIVRRLAELDHEWDLDRAVMANFAVVGGSVFAYGLTRKSGLLYLFASQIAFMLLHATVGWCPPASLFRRLGFRTQQEIGAERMILLQKLDSGPAPGLMT